MCKNLRLRKDIREKERVKESERERERVETCAKKVRFYKDIREKEKERKSEAGEGGERERETRENLRLYKEIR
jgi:hypothetical protein